MAIADWASLEAKPKKNSEFFRVYPGTRYRVRILGDIPWEFAQHWFDVDNKKRPYNCADKNCIACRNGHRPVTKFMMPILVRGRHKAVNFNPYCAIYVFGKRVFEDLKSLRFSAEWGQLNKYDLWIEKPEGNYPYQKVDRITPYPKMDELPDSEKKMVSDFLAKVDLKAHTKPAENKEMLKVIGQKGIFNKDSR